VASCCALIFMDHLFSPFVEGFSNARERPKGMPAGAVSACSSMLVFVNQTMLVWWWKRLPNAGTLPASRGFVEEHTNLGNRQRRTLECNVLAPSQRVPKSFSAAYAAHSNLWTGHMQVLSAVQRVALIRKSRTHLPPVDGHNTESTRRECQYTLPHQWLLSERE
jgi:hypothetical protein